MAADTMSCETLQMNLSSQSLDVHVPDPLENSGDNIRVYVRVRPPTEREQVAAAQPTLSIDRATSSVLLRGDQPRTFTFDGVLGEEASQDEAFDLVGRRISSSCLAGYNGSVYVYGQTGVGKTYTLFGPVSSVQSMHFDERRGLICRILDHVFTEINRRRSPTEGVPGADGVSYLCRCSFLEIYKEQITDLLEMGNSNLQVREDMHHGVYVDRLSEPTVWSLTEAFQVLWKGLQQRHVGATQMNERSSRSHAVFTLSVEVAQTRAGVTSTRIARLSLVDLAGSERQPGTLDQQGVAAPYQSVRVKEAAAINRSLSALTNVIMSLSRAATSRRRSSGDGRRPYVHYRDSKLTFLLRDSLGGNSKTVIVANMSPSGLCFNETLSTLKFAARAKHIRCAAVRNEEYSGTVESLMEEVKVLRGRLQQLSSRDYASRAQLALSDSTLALGKDLAAAAGVAALASPSGDESIVDRGEDESQVLYSRKRVRRLEVLLAAGLERERLADHRRHQLHRLAGFLEDLDFRKSQHMLNLHKDFADLAKHIEKATATSEDTAVADMSAKLTGFGHLLGNLVGCRGQAKPSDPVEVKPDVQSSSGAPVARSGRKRGTSQSMQRGSSDRSVNLQSADPAMSTNPRLQNGLGTSRGGSGDGTQFSFAGCPGGLVEEANFLRQENCRLQQQLECHSEVARLAAENKVLRQQLAAMDTLAVKRDRSKSPDQARSSSARVKMTKSERKADTSLTNTLRSVFSSMMGESASARSPSNSSDEGDKEQSAGATTLQGLSVSAEMMQRIADVDEDSTLRAWVHFQKMAKEVEELIRAKENLTGMAKQMRSHDGLWAALGSKGEAVQRTPSLKNCVEPQVIEDLVQTTQDALALAQNIIDSRGGPSGPPVGAKEIDDASEENVPGNNGLSGALLLRQRLSNSSLQQATSPLSSKSSTSGFRARSRSKLLSVNEQEDSPRASRFPLSGLHNTPAAVAASAASLKLPSPRSEPSEKVEVRQALQRVKHLHGTLDLVSSAYNDAYDQFQRLREEYESRLEECQFFELQCSRLDLQCHELAERLHGTPGSPSVRPGMGSFSATGISSAMTSSTQRRCFSLSSLRDVNFWEQRFQELSQLTGIDEAERGEANSAASGTNARRPVPRLQVPVGKATSVPSSGSTMPSATVRPVVVVGGPQVLLQSMSLSALHSDDEPLRGPKHAAAWGEAASVRRVASAPLLPTFNDPARLARSLAVPSSARTVAQVAVSTEEVTNSLSALSASVSTQGAPKSAPMPSRSQPSGPATVGALSELSELRNLRVDPNMLGRHIGNDNRQAPQQFSHQMAGPLPPASGMPSGLAPTLNGVPVIASQASTASLHGGSSIPVVSVSSQDLLNESVRNRAAQPPPLSLSGAISAREGMLRGSAGDAASSSPPALASQAGGSPRMAAARGAMPGTSTAPMGSSVGAPAGSSLTGPASARPLSRTTPVAQRSQSRGLNTRPRVVASSQSPGASTTRGPLAFTPTHRYGGP